MFPELHVPGIKREDEWELFGVSYFDYYKIKVDDLRAGRCGFCTIDRKINQVMEDVSNKSWMAWMNKLGKSEGHQYRFVIVCRRHVTTVAELEPDEMADLLFVVRALDKKFEIDGGYLMVRSGNPLKNAKSMPHLHFNYQIPTGLEKVEITLAKDPKKLAEKAVLVSVFEKLRADVECRSCSVDEAFGRLSPADQLVVKGKLHNPSAVAA